MKWTKWASCLWILATIAPASHPGGSLLCPNNTVVANCGTATRPPGVNP